VWKIQKSNMSKVAESASYGDDIYAIAEDTDYIYVGGDYNTRKVWKLNKADMSPVAESPAYGDTIYAIAVNSNYVYVGGYVTQKVWKLNISDLSKVAESADYGDDIYAMVTEEEIVVEEVRPLWSGTHQAIWIFLKEAFKKRLEPVGI